MVLGPYKLELDPNTRTEGADFFCYECVPTQEAWDAYKADRHDMYKKGFSPKKSTTTNKWIFRYFVKKAPNANAVSVHNPNHWDDIPAKPTTFKFQ